MRPLALASLFGMFALAAGCGGSGPPAAIVSGEVLMDGSPVAKGTVSLAPLDGTGPVSAGEIVAGKYEVRTTAGKKRVMISVPVVVDKKKDSNAADARWVEITAEGLPDKYHAKSDLTLDVQAGGQTKNWETEGVKKRK